MCDNTNLFTSIYIKLGDKYMFPMGRKSNYIDSYLQNNLSLIYIDCCVKVKSTYQTRRLKRVGTWTRILTSKTLLFVYN